MDALGVLREIAPFSFISRNRLQQVPEDLQPSPKRMRAFFEKCDLGEDPQACVTWRGTYNSSNRPYAQFWLRGRNRHVRKLMWVWFRFDDSEELVPDWKHLVMEASCGNLRCVNPKHLRKGKYGKKSFRPKAFIRQKKKKKKKRIRSHGSRPVRTTKIFSEEIRPEASIPKRKKALA